MSSVRDVRLSRFFFFFNDTATTEIYTLSLHDALPISTLGARPERPPPAVLLRDDAAGEGQPDPPATRLVGSAGLEELMLHIRRDSRPIIPDADPTNRVAALHLDLDPASAAAQGVDRILDDDLERPFDEHRITGRHRPGARRREGDGHGMRQRRQPRPEVRHDALGDSAQSDRLASRGPADALEPLGDAVQALGVRFKMGDEVAPWGIRILAEVIKPPREAHSRT